MYMEFPIISIKSTHIELTGELSELIDQKFKPLAKLFPKGTVDTTCNIEIEKINDQHSGRIFRAEINLYISGVLHRAEATEEQIEKAIDEVRDEVRKELRRAGKKELSLFKKGARKIKELMIFGD